MSVYAKMLGIGILALGVGACKARPSSSAAKDINYIDPDKGTSTVLYLNTDAGKQVVHYRECQTINNGNDRSCKFKNGTTEEKSMALGDYLSQLGFSTMAFSLDQSGLDSAKAALQAAKEASAPKETVDKLQRAVDDLNAVLGQEKSIMAYLNDPKPHPIYAFDKKYPNLLAPFQSQPLPDSKKARLLFVGKMDKVGVLVFV